MRSFVHLTREQIEQQLDVMLDAREYLRLDSIDTKLNELKETFMAFADDVKAALDAAKVKLDANTSALSGIADFITSLKVQIAALQTQLANAGDDPAKVQAVQDGLAALNTSLDAQATAEAALANTPAAP